jgi:hypothetical protein
MYIKSKMLGAGLALLLAVAACSLGGIAPTPSPQDIQTAIAQTQAAQPSPTASEPLPATSTAEAPTAEPTGTPTPAVAPPTATALPPPPQDVEVIAVAEPGRLSRVVSPVRVAGTADPTFEQNLVIEVLGEDGGQLALMPTTIGADVGQRGPFEAEVPFTVTAEQPGRIIVYSDSPRDGGLTHLASVEVTLLPAGAAEIQPYAPIIEEIFIHQPGLTETVSGGVAHVAGISAPTFEQNLVVEIRDAEGNVIGSDSTTIQADIGQAGPYSADVAYTVSAEGPGRIVVYHTSARDGGILHLASVEVMLAP